MSNDKSATEPTSPEPEKRTKVAQSDIHTQLEFVLSEEQKAAVLECIKHTGKISIQLRTAGVTTLPGRGHNLDTEGKLID